MDLGTVKHKLEENEYSSVAQWKSDVDLIWENTYTFNGKQSLISCLARFLQNEAKELTEFISDNDKTDWANKLTDLKQKFNSLMNDSPKGYQIPKPKPKAEEPAPKPEVKKTTTKSKKQAKASPSTPSKRYQPPPPQNLSSEEIQILTSKVNELSDDKHIAQVFELIKRNQPDLITGDDVEIEIDKMLPKTLVALQRLVNSFEY
ncbi:Bromodomain containing protein [Histomonas meleagridis]|uniref:Bromodomain containing protein n=1 Tax=Histomonas meleagridis TaxID=135588 RepID=UPI00355A5ACA|nr:Bromodomain containing protein [Histomonas meleagridis]KAH0796459.1 Bromodomain containing protein [Histomonas meleagridis]